MSRRAGETTGGARSPRRRAASTDDAPIDLDRARARANRAVARAARGGAKPLAGPARGTASGRSAPARTASGSRPTTKATKVTKATRSSATSAGRASSSGRATGRAGASSGRPAATTRATGRAATPSTRPPAGGRSRAAGTARPSSARRTTGSGARGTVANRRAAEARPGTPVRVVSTTPRRAAPPAPRRAPAPPPAGSVLARGHETAAAIAHFFGHTPSTRQRVLPDKVTRARSTRRLTASAAVLILIFGVVVVRLVDLQVLNPAAYARIAQRTQTEILPADRGTITDRSGTPLAMYAPATSIFVDGKLMGEAKADPRADALLLASALEADPAAAATRAVGIEATMRDAGSQFTYVARQVPTDIVEKVRAIKEEKDPADPEGRRKKLIGVAFLDEPKRFRPGGDSARSLIGDVDVDGIGMSGIERRYGDQLTGTPGKIVIERSPGGQTIAPSEPKIEPAVKGRDVQLTIDRALQFDTEQILAEQVRVAKGASGVAIVAKPDTGEILAMANVVAEREGTDVTDVHVSSRNAAVIDSYEPGSVMKLVTAAGALEDGVVDPDTTLPAGPTIRVCNQTFHEAEPSHALLNPSTVSEIIAKSSNVGTIQMGQKLGRDALYRYLRAFGFGSRTAVDFPDELAGVVLRPDRPDEWSCSADGSVPIGQSVSVTPLQVLAAYNTIANGGVYVPPRLLAATVDGDGTRHAVPMEPGRRVVSTETANQLNLMLRSVVADGTGTAAAIAGYTPAGKTGTAKQPMNGSYADAEGKTHYDATFAGFVPAEAPALSILVLIKDPGDAANIYGGTAAAPAFSRIGAAALQRFDVAPPSTDLAAGGTAVDADRSDPTYRAPGGGAPPVGTGLERTPDGRVRVRPAGITTTTAPPSSSTAPGRKTGTATTRSTARTPTTRAASAAGAGATTTRPRR